MMKYNFVSCFVLLIFIFANTSCGSKRNVTKLVDEVCAKTSNYSFCVESLYSDPHASDSDLYGLAFVGFHLAYTSATSTKDYITKQLKKGTSTPYRMRLQRCVSDYENATSALERAYGDLNSENFSPELADYAIDASNDAQHCQATFKGYQQSQLQFMNNNLKGLCETCVAICKLFAVS